MINNLKTSQVLKNDNFYFGKVSEDWKWKTVDEIKKDKKALVSGPFGSNIGKRFFRPSGVPVIRGNNLKQDKFVDSGFVFVDDEKADELKNCIAVQDDIIFTAAGTIGQVGIIPKNGKYSKYIISNKQIRLRINPDVISPLFAFYWFSSKKMQGYLISNNVGSALPLLTLQELKSVPIPVPSIPEQNKITKILNDFDEKIQNLQKQNKILEQIAQTVFKSWFVDYEFPDEEGKPYRSSGGKMAYNEELETEIPKWWKVGKLENLVKITSGKGLRRDEFNENGKYVILGANGELGKTEKYLFDEKLILTGRVGTLGVVYLSEKKCWISDNVLISKPLKNENYYYTFLVMKRYNFESLNRGSTQPLITQTDLKNQHVILPYEKTLVTFHRIVEDLFEKIIVNKDGINLLSQIRDVLLPKLMSGKIRMNVKNNKIIK